MDIAQDSLDAAMQAGWLQCRDAKHAQAQKYAQASSPPSSASADLKLQIRNMWQLRESLREGTAHPSSISAISMADIFGTWRTASTLQKVTRQVRKAGRERRVQKVEQVLASDNIYRASKILAPKAPRRRVQLRNHAGQIQTAHEEFEQVVQFFKELYDGPVAEQIVLDRPVQFTLE